MMMLKRRDNTKALMAFVARKQESDAMLARIAALSDDHFQVAPDTVTCGHVGSLEDYVALLKRITDTAFREGEHAG